MEQLWASLGTSGLSSSDDPRPVPVRLPPLFVPESKGQVPEFPAFSRELKLLQKGEEASGDLLLAITKDFAYAALIFKK